MKKFSLFLIPLLFSTTLLFAQEGFETPKIAFSKPIARATELVIGTAEPLTSLHPLFATTAADKLILGLLHRPITASDASGASVCFLCDKVPTAENDLVQSAPTKEDGNLVAVTLRLPEKAVWGDSTPLTSDDVFFTWQLAKTLNIPSPFYQNIKSIDILTPRKVTLHLSSAAYNAFSLHEMWLVPAHVEKIALQSPETYQKNSRYALNPLDAGLYAGAYRLLSKSATEVVVVPNETWWGSKKPILKKIIIRFYPLAETLSDALKTQKVDMILPPSGLYVDTFLETLQAIKTSVFNIETAPSNTLEHLVPNFNTPLLQDIRVRKALFASLDLEKFNTLALQNKRTAAFSFLPEQNVHFNKSLKTNNTDKEKAAALFAAAGFNKGADGVLMNAQKERLSFVFSTVKEDPSLEVLQQLIRNAWQEMGVATTVENFPQTDFYGRVLPTRAFDIALIRSTITPTTPPTALFGSTSIPSAENQYTGENYGGWQNPQIDSLLSSLPTTLETARKKEQWDALQSIYTNELPTLPLYFAPALTVLPRGIQNVPVTDGTTPQTLNAETWGY